MPDITISFAGRTLKFHLAPDTGRWTAADPATVHELDEGDYPLIGMTDGRRYEVYSDGTFAEVEL
jgi:hypothetical protein